jgi:hypothetical protein
MGLRLSRLVPAIQMASSSMTGTSASEEDNSARVQGRSGWEGSEVTPADISWVTSTRRVPRVLHAGYLRERPRRHLNPANESSSSPTLSGALVCRHRTSTGTSSTPTTCNLTTSRRTR